MLFIFASDALSANKGKRKAPTHRSLIDRSLKPSERLQALTPSRDTATARPSTDFSKPPLNSANTETKNPILSNIRRQSETYSNSLKDAIINEDVNEIRRLLQIVDVNNIRYNSGVTPLHLASYYSVEILALFIKAGANIDARDYFGNTSLHIVNTLEKARMLLRAGADPSAKNNHGATPLHYAHAKMTKFLIEEANVNVHAKDNFGYTPLDYAINQSVMNKLVEEVRSRDDAMGQHYLGNRFQAFSSGLYIALRKPTETSEMKTKINALVSAGAILSIESTEAINILNILTSTEEL